MVCALVLGVPFAGGSPAGPLGGPPPASSLRTMGARFWVGVPPLPSPPLWPLALGARDRLGGGGSLPSPRLPVPSPRALSWGFRPPPPTYVRFLWPAPARPDCASRQRSRSRADGLCYRVPSAAVSLLLGRRGPRGDWASHCRGRSRAGGVCFWVPRASGLLLRPCLRLCILSSRYASSRRAVSAIGWALSGGLGGGWVFLFSPPPASVLPPSGSGRCGGSQGFDSLGAPILSGGRVIP